MGEAYSAHTFLDIYFSMKNGAGALKFFDFSHFVIKFYFLGGLITAFLVDLEGAD